MIQILYFLTDRTDDTIIIMMIIIIKTMADDDDDDDDKVIQRQELCIRDQNEAFVAVFRERRRIAVIPVKDVL